MQKPKVAITKYQKPTESLRKAVELIDALSSLNTSDKVIIKPNALLWDYDHYVPPFGVFTTTRMVEDMVIILKDFGVTDIAIGEGSVQIYESSPKSIEVMKNLGYDEISKRYNVNLIDFNDSKTEKIKLSDDLTISVAAEVLSCDFLIDIPAMKTHSQTKVSLGFKNLKGCLKTSSKRLCHHPELELDQCVSLIVEKIKPDLTVIDGIYILEKGPIHTGKAYRGDLIIASNDILAADVVGTELMGIPAKEIGHLKQYADRNDLSIDLKDYEILGEEIDSVKVPVKWDWNWNEKNTGPTVFERMGIDGVAVPKYDYTLCTGCSPIVNMSNIFIISAQMKKSEKAEPFSNFEILSGKKMKARPGYDKTILLGNCIIKANRNNPNIKEAVEVKGCPPMIESLKEALSYCGVDFEEGAYDYYLNQLATKYDDKEGFDKSFYTC
jgi:uncharacterized protein (DUF362 family)